MNAKFTPLLLSKEKKKRSTAATETNRITNAPFRGVINLRDKNPHKSAKGFTSPSATPLACEHVFRRTPVAFARNKDGIFGLRWSLIYPPANAELSPIPGVECQG